MRIPLVVCVISAALGVGCSPKGPLRDGGAGSTGGGGTVVEGMGGHGGQAGSPGMGGAPGIGGADGGSDAAHDAAETGDAGAACAGAVAQGSCSSEGTVCSNGCTDVCQFCNLLRCTGGHWQPQEVAPAPCFACGPTLRCQSNTQFCRVQVGGAVTNPPSYQCRTTPAACLPTPSCLCLRNQGAAETICAESDAGTGQLTTTLLAP